MAWLVFISACKRLLEALPVFIEVNARARLLSCLCHRCKLWQKENNPVAHTAPGFHPSWERAVSGSSLDSFVAVPPTSAYPQLLLTAVVVRCPGAQQKLESVVLHQRLAAWKQRDQDKAPLKASVLDSTASYPVTWSGINRAPDLRAGKALGGHVDNLPTSQKMILLGEYLLELYCACFEFSSEGVSMKDSFVLKLFHSNFLLSFAFLILRLNFFLFSSP